jgi:hypothetical protein
MLHFSGTRYTYASIDMSQLFSQKLIAPSDFGCDRFRLEHLSQFRIVYDVCLLLPNERLRTAPIDGLKRRFPTG